MSFRRLILSVAALAALAACEREAPMPDQEVIPSRSDGAIVFGVQKPEATKTSGSIDQAALQASGFGVFACHTGDLTYETTSVQPNFMYNQAVNYVSSAWNYEPVKYWPQAQDHISFFAYAPYEASPSMEKCIAAFSPVDALGDPWLLYKLAPEVEDQVDLLYGIKAETGAPWLDVQRQNAAVNFTFRHALACIGDEITIAASPELKQLLTAAGASLTITGVTVNYTNLTAKGRLVLNSTGSPKWEGVYSGNLTTSRSVSKTGLSVALSTLADAAPQALSTGQGLFYIPLTLEDKPAQQASVTVYYTYSAGPVDGSTSASFPLSETAGATQSIALTMSEDLTVFPTITTATAATVTAPNETSFTWSEGKTVQLFDKTGSWQGTLKSNASGILSGKSARLLDADADDNVTLYYPAENRNYAGQTGLQADLCNFSYLEASVPVSTVEDGVITLGDAEFSHQQAYWKLSFSDVADVNDTPLSAESLSIWTEDNALVKLAPRTGATTYYSEADPLVITPSSDYTDFYLAIDDRNAAEHTYHFSLEVDDVVFVGTHTVPAASFAHGTLTTTAIKLTKTYNAIEKHLTLEATEDGTTVSFKNGTYGGSVEYSIDGGAHWLTISQGTTQNISLDRKEKVLFRANQEHYNSFNSHIGADKDCYIYGNIMSLLYKEDFSTKVELVHDGTFSNLFEGSESKPNRIINHPIKDLVLPATKISSECYRQMFAYTRLSRAPVLPATSLTIRCYYGMFKNCTSLTSSPTLPATTLAQESYDSMFLGCSSLTSAPAMAAPTMAYYSCANMFVRCTSLIVAPELPATTLAEGCYYNMFAGCTSLTTGPTTLPATTLQKSCYHWMFYRCTALVSPPILPATELATSCYSHMFYECTSLETAPLLPAPTLSNYCYQMMFNGCTHLSAITCLATDISASQCTNKWVEGVSNIGTFTKASAISEETWTRTANGIHWTWTVVDYVAP